MTKFLDRVKFSIGSILGNLSYLNTFLTFRRCRCGHILRETDIDLISSVMHPNTHREIFLKLGYRTMGRGYGGRVKPRNGTGNHGFVDRSKRLLGLR